MESKNSPEEQSNKETRSMVSNMHSCLADADIASDRLFPCQPNDAVREALAIIMHNPRIEIEVAGGIVRHNVW